MIAKQGSFKVSCKFFEMYQLKYLGSWQIIFTAFDDRYANFEKNINSKQVTSKLQVFKRCSVICSEIFFAKAWFSCTRFQKKLFPAIISKFLMLDKEYTMSTFEREFTPYTFHTGPKNAHSPTATSTTSSFAK